MGSQIVTGASVSGARYLWVGWHPSSLAGQTVPASPSPSACSAAEGLGCGASGHRQAWGVWRACEGRSWGQLVGVTSAGDSGERSRSEF